MAEHLTKRRRGYVPFGYEPNTDDPACLMPVPRQLKALEQAYAYLDARRSLREVAGWLSSVTGRAITHEGLRKSYKKARKAPAKAHGKRRSATAAPAQGGQGRADP